MNDKCNTSPTYNVYSDSVIGAINDTSVSVDNMAQVCAGLLKYNPAHELNLRKLTEADGALEAVHTRDDMDKYLRNIRYMKRQLFYAERAVQEAKREAEIETIKFLLDHKMNEFVSVNWKALAQMAHEYEDMCR